MLGSVVLRALELSPPWLVCVFDVERAWLCEWKHELVRVNHEESEEANGEDAASSSQNPQIHRRRRCGKSHRWTSLLNRCVVMLLARLSILLPSFFCCRDSGRWILFTSCCHLTASRKASLKAQLHLLALSHYSVLLLFKIWGLKFTNEIAHQMVSTQLCPHVVAASLR